MDTKCLLELILIFVLQFEGISGEFSYLYNRPGEDVILPCATASPSDPTCSIVKWLYNRDQSLTLIVVEKGNVRQSSARADRLSVETNCSLVINNINAEDVGFYTCRQGSSINQDAFVFLSVLTVSPSPPDADPKRDGEVTLECSLLTHSDLLPCRLNSIRWLDETGAVLRGEGVGYSFLGQSKCVSSLTVKRQSGHNRKYTCQLVNEQNNVEIQADYTPDFTDVCSTDPTGWSPLSYVMLALRIAGLILMIVITALLIRHTCEDIQILIW
ncbi:neural cell adhesion molecule L1-like isoform X2 [Sebastes fasciatus]|uniref:neural cell adhesion molecule L1-like isoform X2 n=1 Tax=Sebastes fasciatus TaxID=394691 RepID=UPI003D9E6185